MRNQFPGYHSFITYFFARHRRLFVCMILKAYIEFLIHRENINYGILTGIAELIHSWSAQEYSLLCPLSHEKLCPRVTAAVKDLSVFPL